MQSLLLSRLPKLSGELSVLPDPPAELQKLLFGQRTGGNEARKGKGRGTRKGWTLTIKINANEGVCCPRSINPDPPEKEPLLDWCELVVGS